MSGGNLQKKLEFAILHFVVFNVLQFIRLDFGGRGFDTRSRQNIFSVVLWIFEHIS